MSQSEIEQPEYRTVILPGLGRVQVPQGVSEAQVVAEVLGQDDPATPKKKTKKKP